MATLICLDILIVHNTKCGIGEDLMGIDSIGEYIQRMSIRQIAILMGFATFIAPNILWSYPVRDGDIIVNIGFMLTAFSWTYSVSYPILMDGFQFLNSEILLGNSIFTVPPILFAILVIRYCQGKNTSREVWIVAFLSVALPMFTGLSPMVSYFLSYGIFIYAGIIPIQLILGYLIVKYQGSPLDGLQWGDEQDSSKHVVTWWTL
ncbi:MAG: hypothetical protein ACTSQZ_00160 [Candidatus Thorarchaeota archaeon]